MFVHAKKSWHDRTKNDERNYRCGLNGWKIVLNMVIPCSTYVILQTTNYRE